MISFSQLLVLETVGITAVLFLLFYHTDRPKKPVSQNSGKIPPIYAIVFLALALASAYLLSPLAGEARSLYFLEESLVLGICTAAVATTDDPRVARAAIVIVIGFNVLNGLVTKLALGGTVWGEDERGYMMNSLQIGASMGYGTIQSGFYQVPVVSQLLYSVSSVTSLPLDVTMTILSSIFMVLFQGVLYLFTRYFTKDLRVAFMIQVIGIFIPRLDLMQIVIPEPLSLILGGASMYLFSRIVLLDTKSPIRDFVLAMTLYLTGVLTHPSGAIAVLTLAIFTTIAYAQRISISRAGYRLEIVSSPRGFSISRILMVITAIVTAAYWISVPQVLNVVASQLAVFIHSFTTVAAGAKQAGVSYTPLYTQSGLQYTIPWAIPVAVGSAYYLLQAIRRRRPWSKVELLGGICYVSGTLLVVGSFVLLAGAATSNADRYLGSPGYLLLLLSLAPALGYAFGPGRRALLACLLLLVLVTVAIGPSIPDISPDSHASVFEPPSSSTVLFYGSTLQAYPNGAILAAEKNFQPPVNLVSLNELKLTAPYSASYKDTRNLLGGINAGTTTLASVPRAFLVIDSTYLPGFLAEAGNSSNILMSSGQYFVVQYSA